MRNYALAVAVTALALVLTLAIPAIESQAFFTFFVGAVVVSAWVGDWKAGVLSTVLSAAASAYFILPPAGFRIEGPTNVVRFSGFLATALLICYLRRLLDRRNGKRDADETESPANPPAGVDLQSWKWEYYPACDRIGWDDTCNTFRMRREQAYPQWLLLVHPEDRQRIQESVTRGLREGQFETSYRFQMNSAGVAVNGAGVPEYCDVLSRALRVVRDGKPMLTGFIWIRS